MNTLMNRTRLLIAAAVIPVAIGCHHSKSRDSDHDRRDRYERHGTGPGDYRHHEHHDDRRGQVPVAAPAAAAVAKGDTFQWQANAAQDPADCSAEFAAGETAVLTSSFSWLADGVTIVPATSAMASTMPATMASAMPATMPSTMPSTAPTFSLEVGPTTKPVAVVETTEIVNPVVVAPATQTGEALSLAPSTQPTQPAWVAALISPTTAPTTAPAMASTGTLVHETLVCPPPGAVRPDGRIVAAEFSTGDGGCETRRFFTAQNQNGAAKDATLIAAHFTQGKLNSLGRQKLDLMLNCPEVEAPVTLFLNVPADDTFKSARQDAVVAYLKTKGLGEGDVTFKAGVNKENDHPVAASVDALRKMNATAGSTEAVVENTPSGMSGK